MYEPTKHVFKTDKNGRILSFESYTAVTNDSFTIAITNNEKRMFETLDSFYKPVSQLPHRQIVFSNITGFKQGGLAHFPLGVKLPK